MASGCTRWRGAVFLHWPHWFDVSPHGLRCVWRAVRGCSARQRSLLAAQEVEPERCQQFSWPCWFLARLDNEIPLCSKWHLGQACGWGLHGHSSRMVHVWKLHGCIRGHFWYSWYLPVVCDPYFKFSSFNFKFQIEAWLDMKSFVHDNA